MVRGILRAFPLNVIFAVTASHRPGSRVSGNELTLAHGGNRNWGCKSNTHRKEDCDDTEKHVEG